MKTTTSAVVSIIAIVISIGSLYLSYQSYQHNQLTRFLEEKQETLLSLLKAYTLAEKMNVVLEQCQKHTNAKDNEKYSEIYEISQELVAKIDNVVENLISLGPYGAFDQANEMIEDRNIIEAASRDMESIISKSSNCTEIR